MPRKQRSLFPELDEIIAKLHANERQDLVILIIPSHDRKQQELADQDMWAEAALELFADLYGGATAFNSFKGVYRTDQGAILWDNPILIESYVRRADLEDVIKLHELLQFSKRMGRETRQAAVAIIVNNVFHEITNFKQR